RRAVVIVSRPYNGCDPGVSLDLPGKLAKLGVLAIPMDFLDLEGVAARGDRVFENMYWKYGQRILRAATLIRQDDRLNAIYLSNFGCGPDSFIIGYFKKLMASKPALVLEIDEHSADAGVVTRLEAFLESLGNASGCASGQWRPLYPDRRVDCGRRTLYIPWMGDAAYALAAAFRACGQPAEVLPLADERTIEVGRQYSSGKECLPCIITTGDMVKRVSQRGFEPARVAFFMPGGSGPCRFGQYNCMQKLVLAELGYGDVPVVAPSQDERFYEDFKQFRRDPTRLAWTGIVACELLGKVRLALRAYEAQAGQVDEVYRQWLERLCRLIETGPQEDQVRRLLAEAAEAFAAVRLSRQDRPRIGVVGEIYVRCHDFANNRVVRQLESLGAEVAVASFSEWMYYTNLTRRRWAWRERSWRDWLQNRLKDRVQRRIEQRLARPLERLVGPLVEPPIEHVLMLARPYIHDSFEGEAVLSVGKTVEFCHLGFDGVVNVMPFTCMPSTIVSGLMKKLSEDLGGMPTLSISYDGQQDPTLQTRLEAFVEQSRVYRRLRRGKASGPLQLAGSGR
ncbi:MAG: CoA activase, partial [Phycisphaerae bacterium]